MLRGAAAFLLLDEPADQEWTIPVAPVTGASDIAPIAGADFIIMD